MSSHVPPSDYQWIATIITALGGPLLLLSLGRTIYTTWKTRGTRRAQRARTIEAAEADKRKALEYASQLRRQLTEAGIRPEPWPKELGRAPRVRTRRAQPKEEESP